MKRNPYAPGAGLVTPANEQGPAFVPVPAPQEVKQGAGPDPGNAPHGGQALRVIEGETKAAQYLARLQAQQADPDELALIVSMLYGATLRGFCRVLGRALGVRHE